MASIMWGFMTGFFTYETTKSVVVKSWTVGVINRVIQLLIVIYFVGWVFVHEKAYQGKDTGIESSVMTKVKGFGYHHNQVMDVADYVSPSQGAAIFCIMTNLVITDNQFQARCAETVPKFVCETDMDCHKYFGSNTGNGIITGTCLLSKGMCEIEGWCPAENIMQKSTEDKKSGPLNAENVGLTALVNMSGQLDAENVTASVNMSGQLVAENVTASVNMGGQLVAENVTASVDRSKPPDVIKKNAPLDVSNFTIFIKNSIRFPLFDVTRGNFPSTMTSSQIQSCAYHPVTSPYCPIFRLGDIITYTKQNATLLTKKGGEIGINIEWKCNLDLDVEECKPKYSFTRLDSAFDKNPVSKGYNFRFAKYFKTQNGTEFRKLYKAYGIRIDILVTGNAGKFSTVPTLINLVAAFTSVGLGTVLCDLILLNFLKEAKQYKAKKFEEVSGKQIETLSRSQDSQLSIRPDAKHFYDSGNLSLSNDQAL